MGYDTARYIGDAKHGRLVGTDILGNKYFENTDPTQEVPGKSLVTPYLCSDPSLFVWSSRILDHLIALIIKSGFTDL